MMCNKCPDPTICGGQCPADELKLLDFEQTVQTYFDANMALLVSKHRDYGATNISNAPGGALNGLRVRIHDKSARINNLIDNNKLPEHESLRDSFIDMANYAIIALMVIDGEWPNE